MPISGPIFEVRCDDEQHESKTGEDAVSVYVHSSSVGSARRLWKSLGWKFLKDGRAICATCARIESDGA